MRLAYRQVRVCVCECSRENKECRTLSGAAVGEHAITVRLCERDPSAADDRTLTLGYDPMAEVTVLNASEIRFEPK